MARAKLVLEITNQDDPTFKIGGRVSPKDFCAVFCTVLGSTASAPTPVPGVKPITGYGLFDLNKDGSLDYRIRLFNANDQQITSLTISKENKENKEKPRLIEGNRKHKKRKLSLASLSPLNY
jgi:hypothetical protein